MKATRINFCSTIREALTEAGYSTVKAVNALNGELQALELANSKSTTKGGTIKGRKIPTFSVKVQTSEGYESRSITPAMELDTMNTALEKLEKTVEHFTVTLPASVCRWLDGFATNPLTDAAKIENKPSEVTVS